MTAGNAAKLTIGIERLMVGGARVASLNLEQTAHLMLDLAQERAGAGHPLYLTSVNGEVLARRYRNPDFADLVDAADLISADGQAYDPNGNTLTLPRPDGTALGLAWTINNELIAASNSTGDTATYAYDALGRRVSSLSTINSQPSTTYFFTNGWNVELEYKGGTGGSPVLSTRLTWGLDLSGSLQGAGGVGGLVMVETLISQSPIPYFPLFDGNGNITAWIDASGSVIATQRYDAYGNLIQQTGTAPSNYGFSTKPQEKVTGLLYYGYRYYDPATGRWPSRDPIGERGGKNLYGFVVNNSVSQIDILGLLTAQELRAITDGAYSEQDGNNTVDSAYGNPPTPYLPPDTPSILTDGCPPGYYRDTDKMNDCGRAFNLKTKTAYETLKNQTSGAMWADFLALLKSGATPPSIYLTDSAMVVAILHFYNGYKIAINAAEEEYENCVKKVPCICLK